MIPSQYRDTDGDGYGDNLNGFEGDVCMNSNAEEVESGWISRFDRLGCRDVDKDGYSDPTDDWIAHPQGFADAFPNDSSQWYDTDNDGFGDNMEYFDGQAWRLAYRGDGCKTTYGLSTFDRWGCPDSDEDGWSDPTPYWLASPGGTGDAWPEDPTQWHDRDGDGRGDNPSGTTADVCPSQPGTSVGPSSGGDRWGCPDTDGDGWSNLGDAFIHEPTQWRDSDGDGYGDEVDGNEADACPTIRGTSILDRLGCRDTDGDGWSDPTDGWDAHPYGSADAFPTEALQWKDSDGDGFGDVPLGALRDDCPEEFGTSIRDLQGCEDNNGDGWSNEYGEWNAALAIMGEDPAASWLTYLIVGISFILGASAALIVRTMRSEDEKSLTEELLIGEDSSMNSAVLPHASEVALPELAIPLPPPPGGENDAKALFCSPCVPDAVAEIGQVRAEADIGLEEAGITMVALRNDTLDLNQDGDIDAVRVVVILNSTAESTFVDVRLIATHNDREVIESTTIEIVGQTNASLTYDAWSRGSHDLALGFYDMNGVEISTISLPSYEMVPALQTPMISLQFTGQNNLQTGSNCEINRLFMDETGPRYGALGTLTFTGAPFIVLDNATSIDCSTGLLKFLARNVPQ